MTNSDGTQVTYPMTVEDLKLYEFLAKGFAAKADAVDTNAVELLGQMMPDYATQLEEFAAEAETKLNEAYDSAPDHVKQAIAARFGW